jgi:hypothetical protein
MYSLPEVSSDLTADPSRVASGWFYADMRDQQKAVQLVDTTAPVQASPRNLHSPASCQKGFLRGSALGSILYIISKLVRDWLPGQLYLHRDQLRRSASTDELTLDTDLPGKNAYLGA